LNLDFPSRSPSYSATPFLDQSSGSGLNRIRSKYAQILTQSHLDSAFARTAFPLITILVSAVNQEYFKGRGANIAISLSDFYAPDIVGKPEQCKEHSEESGGLIEFNSA